MRLLPREKDKLMLHYAGALAKERLQRGVKLNYTEAVAYISAELAELARDGKSVTELMRMGRGMLTGADVMDGVANMIDEIQLEATFPDGTKLVTVHNPIEPEKGTDMLVPGEIIVDDGEIIINEGKESKSIEITNTSDRPIQVGSHYHLFEANNGLCMSRREVYGMRLDIPSGTAVRFEPGETRTVNVIPLGGARCVYGLHDAVCGCLDDDGALENALKKQKEAE